MTEREQLAARAAAFKAAAVKLREIVELLRPVRGNYAPTWLERMSGELAKEADAAAAQQLERLSTKGGA